MCQLEEKIKFKEFSTLAEIGKHLSTQTQSGELLNGFGWDASKLGVSEEKLIELFEDCCGSKHEAFFWRSCGHKAFVSRALLKKHQLSEEKTIFLDEDFQKHQNVIPQTSEEQILSNFHSLSKKFNSYQIQQFCDMATSPDAHKFYKNLEEKNLLPFHVEVLPDYNAYQAKLDQIPSFKKIDLKYVKLFLDGSFGASSAWLLENYENSNSNGTATYNDVELKNIFKEILKAGYLPSIHVIGDAALEQALRVAEDFLDAFSNKDYLPRLEHVQLASNEQLLKIKQQKWLCSLQPLHRVDDDSFLESRLGKKRKEEHSHRLKSFLEFEIPILLGSDAPIVSCDPEETLDAASEAGFAEAISRESAELIYRVIS